MGLDTWSAGNEKAPRKIAGPVGRWWRVMSVMHADMKKAPAVLVTVGAGARGLLDDLHAGADAFRGDVDVPGP